MSFVQGSGHVAIVWLTVEAAIVVAQAAARRGFEVADAWHGAVPCATSFVGVRPEMNGWLGIGTFWRLQHVVGPRRLTPNLDAILAQDWERGPFLWRYASHSRD